MTTKKKPLSIYIHIPFCVRKCKYCDFLSGPATDQNKAEYISALLQEIKSYRTLFTEYEIKTVFIGGGTPSSVNATDIANILRTLEETAVFSLKNHPEIETTIEINPGTITKEKLILYKEAGINRISFGLQSTNNKELRLLGRIHTFEEFVENYWMAREVGFKNINIDLMSALPGQTLESYEATLNQVLALNPEHISAYSLIIEEGTPFYEMYGEDAKVTPKESLPSEEAERQMYDLTRRLLHEHGYERYEISNYAKEGYECKHNCTYWRRGEYLGLGCGAASLIGHTRFGKISETEAYVEVASKLSCDALPKELYVNVEHLTTEDEMSEFMFLGLRMMQGVCMTEFEACFKKTISEVYSNVLPELYK